MHLCFIDESGTPAKPTAEKPRFFVIAGLVIPEDKWTAVAARLHGLKTRFQYRGELKWRYFAPQNDDAANPMASWSADQRNNLRNHAFSVIGSDRSVRIIAGVCEARAAYEIDLVKTQGDIYFGTYKVVTERFQYLLQDISRTSGRNTYGIVVADHRGRGDDEIMRRQHQRLIEENRAFTSTYLNFIEGLFLTPSHLSVGVQLADLVAGAIWRRFEANDPYWFDKIRPSLRTASDGRIDGFGIARFPKRGWTGPII